MIIHILTSHKASFTGFHLFPIASISISENKSSGEYTLDNAVQRLQVVHSFNLSLEDFVTSFLNLGEQSDQKISYWTPVTPLFFSFL